MPARSLLSIISLIVLTTWAPAAWSLTSLRENSVMLAQPGAPVTIDRYECFRTADGTSAIYRTTEHRARYVNQTHRDITAIEFRFIMFDIWDDYMAWHREVEFDSWSAKPVIKASKPDKSPRRHSVTYNHALYRGMLLNHAFVYVYRARFADGEIWQVDEAPLWRQVAERMDRPLAPAVITDLVEQQNVWHGHPPQSVPPPQ